VVYDKGWLFNTNENGITLNIPIFTFDEKNKPYSSSGECPIDSLKK
jgi:hypothetical protein